MKKLLLSLFVGLIGFISFSNAVNFLQFNYSQGEYDLVSSTFSSKSFTNSDGALYCFVPQLSTSSCTNNICATIVVDNDEYQIGGWENMYCVYGKDVVITSYNGNKLYYYVRMSGIKLKNFFPDYTSEQCQIEYNLIPISSVDQNYCVNNGLCPSSDCPDNPGDYTGDLQFSNLYINNIFHPGKQNIFLNIPDYIMWDYNVVGDDFNINVGSGYDQDYINSIISINSYRPTSEDFTGVFVSGLTLVMPYIVIVLFIIFVRKLIKKIFR